MNGRRDRRRRKCASRKGRGRWAIASVALQPCLLKRTDGLAALRGWSRSRLVREALEAMLLKTEAPVPGKAEAAAS
jgi:metal-responsive CopG/Arc/MetJ family transcriptional regulator